MGALSLLQEHIEELKESFNSAVIVGNSNIGLTTYMLYVLICSVIVVCVVLIAGRKLTMVPKNRFVNLVELGYGYVTNDIAKSSCGSTWKKHIPFLSTLFFFILIANFVGLIPGAKAATGSISVTWALAIISFVYFNYWGIKVKGGLKYLKEIAPTGIPALLSPVIWFFEVLSTCLRALTLAFRLYGNMFAGHMVLGIFSLLIGIFCQYAICNVDLLSGLPAIAWLLFLIFMYCLEILVAFLQAYVFTTLSAVYVSLATQSH